MRIEIFARRGIFGKRWYFRVRADNGEVIAQSEGYHNRADARATAMVLRNGAPKAGIFCAEGEKA